MRLDEGIVDGHDLHISVLDAVIAHQLELRYLEDGKKAMAGQTYAFRKTIRPIRPKPLMPTSVSDMIGFN